jgi:flagellar hook-basal body complex protein FliE
MSFNPVNGNFFPPLIEGVKSSPENQKTPGVPKENFGEVLKTAIDDIDKLQKSADQAIVKLEKDNSGSLHEAVIALEKADISFRAMMQVRNKIIEAYQEIMRMQV